MALLSRKSSLFRHSRKVRPRPKPLKQGQTSTSNQDKQSSSTELVSSSCAASPAAQIKHGTFAVRCQTGQRYLRLLTCSTSFQDTMSGCQTKTCTHISFVFGHWFDFVHLPCSRFSLAWPSAITKALCSATDRIIRDMRGSRVFTPMLHLPPKCLMLLPFRSIPAVLRWSGLCGHAHVQPRPNRQKPCF